MDEIEVFRVAEDIPGFNTADLVSSYGLLSKNEDSVLDGNASVSLPLRHMSKASVICCDQSPEKYTRIVEIDLDLAAIESRVIETVEQDLAPGTERGLHNAAHHETEGAVTYLQQVHEGGFFVYIGKPDALKEYFFGPGTLVAFADDEGPGHGSKVGPDGIKRTMRVLKGLLEV
ncbi:MAG: hypothetical protein KDN22_16190 [Verrucomicrobiae bacterium]|nr:hypothetical protein [Verrucomicrobiae bacterium]